VRRELGDEFDWRANRLGTLLRRDGYLLNAELMESEAVAYAEMLSREEEESRQAQRLGEELFDVQLPPAELDAFDLGNMVSPTIAPHLGSSPDTSPCLLPLASSSLLPTPPCRAIDSLPLRETEYWPQPFSSSPHTRSPSSRPGSANFMTSSANTSWSDAVRFVAPPWSDSLDPHAAPKASTLWEQLKSSPGAEDEMDADLRYAIELSLAEANSRSNV
jgi:hypothetical protein